MSIRNSGTISVTDLNIALGNNKTAQLDLDSVRSNFGSHVPSSGTISLDDFYGYTEPMDFVFTPAVSGNSTVIDLTGLGNNAASANTLLVKLQKSGDYINLDFMGLTNSYESPAKTVQYQLAHQGRQIRYSIEDFSTTLTELQFDITVPTSNRLLTRNTLVGFTQTTCKARTDNTPALDYDVVLLQLKFMQNNLQTTSVTNTFEIRIDKAGINSDEEPNLNSDLTDNFPSGTITELAKKRVLPALLFDPYATTPSNRTISFRTVSGAVQLRDRAGAWHEVAAPSSYESIHFMWNAAGGNANWDWSVTDDLNQEVQNIFGDNESIDLTVEPNGQAGSVQLNVVFLFTVDSVNEIYETVSFNFKAQALRFTNTLTNPLVTEYTQHVRNITRTDYGQNLDNNVILYFSGTTLTFDGNVVLNTTNANNVMVSMELNDYVETDGVTCSITGKTDITEHNYVNISAGQTMYFNVSVEPQHEFNGVLGLYAYDSEYPNEVVKNQTVFHLVNDAQLEFTAQSDSLSGDLTYDGGYVITEVVPSDGSVDTRLERELKLTVAKYGDYLVFSSSSGEYSILDVSDVELYISIDSISGLTASGINTTPDTVTSDFQCYFTMRRNLFDEFNVPNSNLNARGTVGIKLSQPVSGNEVVFNFSMGFDYSNVLDKVSLWNNPSMALFSPQCIQTVAQDDQTLAGVGLHKDSSGDCWLMSLDGGPTFQFYATPSLKLSTGGQGLQWRVLPSSGTLEKLTGAAWNTWYTVDGNNAEGQYATPNYESSAIDLSLLGTIVNGVFNPTIVGVFGFGMIAPRVSEEPSYFYDQVINYNNSPFVSCVLQVRDIFTKQIYLDTPIVIQYSLK